MSFTPPNTRERKDAAWSGPTGGEFPKGDQRQPDNLCGHKGRVYWETPVLASLLFLISFAGLIF